MKKFRIELVITALVILAGVFFKISHFEWIAISLVISMVLISETINIVEALCTVSQDFKINEIYKRCKCWAVLVSALVSVITGLIIFLPYIILFLQKSLLVGTIQDNDENAPNQSRFNFFFDYIPNPSLVKLPVYSQSISDLKQINEKTEQIAEKQGF